MITDYGLILQVLDQILSTRTRCSKDYCNRITFDGNMELRSCNQLGSEDV